MADLVGWVAALAVTAGELPGTAVERLELQLDGAVGDKHFGPTMKANRAQAPYPKGTQVRNVRQLSIVSAEELAEVAQRLALPVIEPTWIGANLMLAGVPELTQLPGGSRVYFEGGAGLVIEGENMPCVIAGGSLAAQTPGREELRTLFPKHALGKRGLVAWVEKAGVIQRGEQVTVRLAHDVRR
ncbi:MAG: MOSC domain-containing protein [Anaerolineales bacterium]|nr:MOSC domain-containing protein [Anaerolineales bacterium]MCW5888068.1 MOSC domain-containing protein [Anaerolineales bacterium]